MTLTLLDAAMASTDEMTLRGWIFVALICWPIGIFAQSRDVSVIGDWREPTGSIIEIFRCGNDICAKMVAISKQAPTQFDANNPDASARRRPLCGLQIGYGFHLSDPAHADGGKLYDPKTGKTYHGAMTAEGDALRLRGYVGIKAFGKTETWTRASPAEARCAK
jgi:uncharacterized protein (DUF2147 family)